ncbi:MAG: hypothetical protein H7A55_01895 [Verrucomicrobiaceae bacterium]|nr:hypothetical protein [Verrucomicrobiaceae bacterium]
MPQPTFPPILRATTCCLALAIVAACSSKPEPHSSLPVAENGTPILPQVLSQNFDEAAKNYAQVVEIVPGFRLAANRLKGIHENPEGKISAVRATGDFLLFAPGIPLRAIANEIEIADGIATLSGSPVAVQGDAAQASVTGTQDTVFHVTETQFSTSGPSRTQITKAIEPKPHAPIPVRKTPTISKQTKTAAPKPALPKMRLPSDETIPLPSPTAG